MHARKTAKPFCARLGITANCYPLQREREKKGEIYFLAESKALEPPSPPQPLQHGNDSDDLFSSPRPPNSNNSVWVTA